MLLILISACIVSIGHSAQRLRTKDGYQHNYTLPSIELKFGTNQLQMSVLGIPNIYDSQVYESNNGEIGKPVKTPFSSLSQNPLEESLIQNDCISQPKQPKIHQLMNYKLNPLEDVYYTDIVSFPKHQSVFIIEDDLQFKQLRVAPTDSGWVISEMKKVINLADKLQLKSGQSHGNALFSCVWQHNQCLIITQYGGFWFDNDANFDLNVVDVKFEPVIKKRKSIYKVSTFDTTTVVAAGVEGVDIYQQSISTEDGIHVNVTLNHFFQLKAEHFGKASVNIISAKLSWGRLSVLDQYSGLYLFDYRMNEIPQLLMQINIPHSIAFDYHQNTYLVVAETSNRIEYLIEIFVQSGFKEYYVNRVYVDDFTFKDIEITNDYAIIIGEDVHMVIRHSIFNGFLPKTKELVKYFESDDLLKLELYQNITNSADTLRLKEQLYYVSLSKNNIKVWRFLDFQASLLCQFNHGVNKDYIIKSNATQCPSIAYTDVYEQCSITQVITVNVDGILLDSDSTNALITVLSISVFIIIVICILSFKKCCGYINTLRELRRQVKEQKMYGQFQEVEQQSMAH